MTLALTRAGTIPKLPLLLAAIAGATAVVCAVGLVLLLARWRRDAAPLSSRAGELLTLAGLLTVGGAGLAHWALDVQGVAVLEEGEEVAVRGGAGLQEFARGPLASVDDLDFRLGVAEVALKPAAGGGFVVESLLLLRRAGAEPVRTVASSQRAARLGRLALIQGAFGFVPRIVVSRNGVVIHDAFVPFTSSRQGRVGVAFEGRVDLPGHAAALSAAMDLGGLDDRYKGHPSLWCELEVGGEVVGSGTLRPGHFADLKDGWRVGFAGMKRWSEIDLARVQSNVPSLAGIGAAAVGLILWLTALLVRARRPARPPGEGASLPGGRGSTLPRE